jgi:hypothetical protein
MQRVKEMTILYHVLKKNEKDECHGMITIYMSGRKTVRNKTARDKQNTQTLNNN